MRISITILLLSFMTIGYAQKNIFLGVVSKSQDSTKNNAIIYGNFIQRLAFTSGGFSQTVRILHTQTKQMYHIPVKKAFRSKKENLMCFYIPKGEYIIVSYQWTESKWYGGKIHDEKIIKGYDPYAPDFQDKLQRGEIKPEDLKPFTFSIPEAKVYYVGTWNFNSSLVSFEEEKEIFDPIIKSKYKKLKIATATIEIPN